VRVDTSAYICAAKNAVLKVGKLREMGKKRVVFTTGVYDLYHTGHILYLENAALLGDALVVAVDSDARVKRQKDPRKPVMRQDDRLVAVASNRAVDCAFIFEDFDEAFQAVKPEVWVYSPTSDLGEHARRLVMAQAIGTDVVAVESKSAIHTSGLIADIVRRFGPPVP